MAQNDDNDHPYPFMQVQNPTVVGTSVSLPSRNLQHSGLGWLNRGETSASGVQGLASRMEALTLSNPYGLRNYGTNHMHEASLHRMRVIGAANAATAHQVHHHHHPIGGFLGSPGCEQLVWSHSHHNLEPHWGRLVSLAKDPRGYRLLHRKIDNATPREIDLILKELKDHLHELMKHRFGHYVIRKFFQSSNVSEVQVNAIILLIVMDVQKLKDVCMDDQGNRVIQKMLENVETPYMINKITDAMSCITVALMKNLNGGYVIQQFLKLFPPLNKNFILDIVAKNFLHIARDRRGCCVIQKCMEQAEIEAFLQLVNEIIPNAMVLAEDPYGNYVMQFLVKLKISAINAVLISRLCNNYFRLSTNKYASNVVEDLLQFSETDDAAIIVLELLDGPEFLNVFQHPYGNYVVQRALQCTKGSYLALCKADSNLQDGRSLFSVELSHVYEHYVRPFGLGLGTITLLMLTFISLAYMVSAVKLRLLCLGLELLCIYQVYFLCLENEKLIPKDKN
ncbi:Pumilio-like 9 [Spatholobus suberectus]|nr:Pumilio-like 9 [Spatholobus suberectus]